MGDNVTVAVTPVPVSVVFCGLATPLSVIVKDAVRVPAPFGVKVTFTVQDAFAAKLAGLIGQLLVCVKLYGFAPLIAMLVMLKRPGPLLVIVTV